MSSGGSDSYYDERRSKPMTPRDDLRALAERLMVIGVQGQTGDVFHEIVSIERELRALAAAQETPQPGRLLCEDCGAVYADFPLDTTLPDDQWRAIHPEREGGVLCASCIVKRAAKLPDAVAVRAYIEGVAQETPQEPAAEKLERAKRLYELTLANEQRWMRLHQQMADAAEMLWVVLANVSVGDWAKQTDEWQDAAARWRDNYFKALSAHNSQAQETPAARPAEERLTDKCASCGARLPPELMQGCLCVYVLTGRHEGDVCLRCGHGNHSGHRCRVVTEPIPAPPATTTVSSEEVVSALADALSGRMPRIKPADPGGPIR